MAENNGVDVLSEKEEYINLVKSYVENILCWRNICAVDANYAISNRWIIERLELKHEQGKNIIIIGGNREERDFMEIVSWGLEFFRKERVFWARDITHIRALECFLKF